MIAMYPIYAGHLPQGTCKDAPTTILRDTHDPILPVKLCERVAAVHMERHTRWRHGGGGAPKRVYLLEYLYCGECNSHIKGQFKNGQRYYRHSDEKKHCTQRMHVHADGVENQVLERLTIFEVRIREKARHLAAQVVISEGKNAKRLVTELISKLKRLKEMRIDCEIDKSKIEAQLQEAELRVRDTLPDVRTLEDLLPMIDQIAAVISQDDPARQCNVLSALFERTEVLDGKITKHKPREWARLFFNGGIAEAVR